MSEAEQAFEEWHLKEYGVKYSELCCEDDIKASDNDKKAFLAGRASVEDRVKNLESHALAVVTDNNRLAKELEKYRGQINQYGENTASDALESLKQSKPATSASSEQAGQWYSIETAPKDGKNVLIGGSCGVYQCAWRESRFAGQGSTPEGKRWYVTGSETHRYEETDSTHWMPLPNPPTTGKDDNES